MTTNQVLHSVFPADLILKVTGLTIIHRCDRPKHEHIRSPKAFRVAVAGIAILALPVMPAVAADAADRTDDVVMAMMFSFREAAQVHALAYALGVASMNGTPSEEVALHCDRAVDGFSKISIPLLHRYLENVEHDQQARELFMGIKELQQRSLRELEAVKAMAQSGNGQTERMACVAAHRKYNEVATALTTRMGSMMKSATQTDPQLLVEERDGEASSPNARVFSDEQWGDVVAGLRKRGLLGGPNDARAYFGIFALLKSVFVDKDIPDPSISQVFGLAKRLNLPFGSMKPAAIETTLRQILDTAKEADVEVMSRPELLRLSE